MSYTVSIKDESDYNAVLFLLKKREIMREVVPLLNDKGFYDENDHRSRGKVFMVICDDTNNPLSEKEQGIVVTIFVKISTSIYYELRERTVEKFRELIASLP